MICALKNEEGYLAAANANIRLKITDFTPVEKQISLDTLQFVYTNDINQARLIENPDMEAVAKYGFQAVIVEIVDNKVVFKGNVYDSCIS